MHKLLAAGGWRAPPEKVIRRLKMPPCSEVKDRGLMASLMQNALCSGCIKVGLPAAMLFKHTELCGRQTDGGLSIRW